MYYKMIVYQQKFIKVETKRGIKQKVYFEKLATIHGIHKSILSKKYLELYRQYGVNNYNITIDNLLEHEDEKQTLIYKNNEKVKKLVGGLVYQLD